MKDEKGITLMALAITIIALIILSGAAIASLTGGNSMTNRAKQAKESSGKSAANELSELEKYEAAIRNKKVIGDQSDLGFYYNTDYYYHSFSPSLHDPVTTTVRILNDNTIKISNIQDSDFKEGDGLSWCMDMAGNYLKTATGETFTISSIEFNKDYIAYDTYNLEYTIRFVNGDLCVYTTIPSSAVSVSYKKITISGIGEANVSKDGKSFTIDSATYSME